MKSKTIEILESAGWYPDRKIDINASKIILKSKGYTITESFEKFYEKFGSIGFYLSDVQGSARSIGFILEDAFYIEFDEVIIEDYSKITRSQFLTIIGHVNKTSVLVIDENSVIYLLNDGNVMKLGDNAEETLDNLCNVSWSELRKQGEYPIPDWW